MGVSLRSNERGFTLVEALVAAIVLTIGLVAVAELLAVSLRMHMLGRESTTATRLAQDKFEELMKVNWATDLRMSDNTGTDTLASNVANKFDAPNPMYTRRWSVAPGPNTRLRTVTVRVVPVLGDRRVSDVVEITQVLRRW